MHKKKFLASLDHLYDMLIFVQYHAQKQGFEEAITNKIMLATEEALVNIISHGYPHQEQGEIEICCETSLVKPGMKVLIKDQGQGIPFDPVQEAKKRKKIKAEATSECEPGGYGVMIYVGLMDRVEYYRTEEGNLLFLIKYLEN